MARDVRGVGEWGPAEERPAEERHSVLSAMLDVFRLRQYFDVAVRVRQVASGLKEDVAFAGLTLRALAPLPFEHAVSPPDPPFGPLRRRPAGALAGKRVGVAATGGSGALASVVGVARALEEAGTAPAVISVCSGSALFGFPLAAGLDASAVAEFVLSLEPADYVDVDWPGLGTALLRRGRGFAGLLRGDRLEASYRRLLGDMTLAELPIPAYAPIWSIEHNRIEFLGPRTHPTLPVARAVRMAVALPLFFDPVGTGEASWCDGGLVDIFPVRPLADIEDPCDVVLAVNGFYPPSFEGEDASGWRQRRLPILEIASQVRTCQQIELARANLARLRGCSEVHLLEPVPYRVVQGIGFYRQFLTTRQWPSFMRAGRADAWRAIREIERRSAAGTSRDGEMAGDSSVA